MRADVDKEGSRHSARLGATPRLFQSFLFSLRGTLLLPRHDAEIENPKPSASLAPLPCGLPSIRSLRRAPGTVQEREERGSLTRRRAPNRKIDSVPPGGSADLGPRAPRTLGLGVPICHCRKLLACYRFSVTRKCFSKTSSYNQVYEILLIPNLIRNFQSLQSGVSRSSRTQSSSACPWAPGPSQVCLPPPWAENAIEGAMSLVFSGLPMCCFWKPQIQAGAGEILARKQKRKVAESPCEARKQDCPASLRASVGLEDHPGTKRSAGSLLSPPVQDLAKLWMATWSQDSVSAVITISRDKEPCGFETEVNPRNRTPRGPWIVVAEERPRRVAVAPPCNDTPYKL
ncbi:hypothetical protein MJG53_003773 [Ovis ammon polii x Ovis aries]|uniref:Uncharacterized protein n=1 Tax=Ovis ammon polii x Ovis aries TaxID=2918886 RepID=A0ACB9VIZ8_9CETA|nr:hypothetical protein MJG53_003773 [Ovis ammon polii x Ovis aries]